MIGAMTMIRALPLLALSLVACGQTPDSQQDLNGLDAELTASTAGNARDPALTAALADQIMVDPTLAQSSNGNAVRPPPRPDSGAVPPEGIAARTDPTDPATLRKAPTASDNCPECAAAKGALTLGALAARQTDRRAADCAAAIGYGAGWASRLPPELPLYPDARLSEAAGADRNGCRLRVVSFASTAPVGRVIDYYYTQATKGGYSAGHRTDGAQHVVGGTRGEDAYVVYVTPRGAGGSDVDIVSNAGI